MALCVMVMVLVWRIVPAKADGKEIGLIKCSGIVKGNCINWIRGVHT